MPFPSGTYIAQIQDPAVRAEIEQLYALFQGYLQAEHKDSGAHANVTADSATVNGTLTASGYVRVDGADLGPTDNDYQVEITQTRAGLSPAVRLYNRAGQVPGFLLLESGDTAASGNTPFVQLQASGAQFNVGFDPSDGSTSYASLVQKHRFDGSLYERARTKAIGEWTTFTPTLTATTGTWTGSTITTAQYMLIGKTMFVNFEIDAGNNSAVTAALIMAIPGGFTSAKAVEKRGIRALDGNVDITNVRAHVTAGGTTIIFDKDGAATWAINAANGNYVRGQIYFEVQ